MKVPVVYHTRNERQDVPYRYYADLRQMAATNILVGRSRQPLLRAGRAAAEAAFRCAGDGARTVESFEILHFAAWTPAR